MTHQESEQKYKDYVVEHIANVNKVWKTYEPLFHSNFFVDDSVYFQIDHQIFNHDASKQLDSEFYAYKRNFFPADGEEKNQQSFHRAWVHHIANNPHHWEHWVTFEKGKPNPCEMPISFIVEMLCDWTAMSVKFNNIPSVWFALNRIKIILHESTLGLVEKMLPDFDKVFETLTEEATDGK